MALGGTEPAFESSKVSAQGALTMVQSIGGEPQRRGGPVRARFGFPTQRLTTGFLITRTQTEPGGKVFFALPPAHIETDFGDDRQGGRSLNAVDAGDPLCHQQATQA